MKVPIQNSDMKSKGFTLIELMFAIVIVAIGLLGYIQANLAISRNTEECYQRATAFYDAQRVLENMRSVAQTGTFPSNIIAVYPDAQTVSGYSSLPQESVTVNYESASANPLDVTITVSWNSNNRPLTKSIRTLLTQRLSS